ncbi:MAG TPA: neutral zinc metallopeptidase [Myxococcota bacterium]|nr:neutral zinc metallopeptidase [Myxococcota bacterium]
MRWTRGERSPNLEDRRAEGGTTAGVGGLRIPGGLGLGGLVVMLGAAWLLGIDPLTLLGVLSNGDTRVEVPGDTGSAQPRQPGTVSSSPAEEKLVDFVSFVLDDTQATWSRLLPGYTDAQLVLFRNAVDTGCGFAQSAAGPFYCPRDHKVYVDLGFFEELRSRFGAPGDFAQAYVLAHEIGHHVQSQLGIEREVRERQSANPRETNALSVRLELQADCFAGVWGHSTARRDLLDPGDMDEGLAAAAAVGDDRIQEMATGQVRPESFTHGSSQQRTEWFRRGFESGDPKACDTFGSSE